MIDKPRSEPTVEEIAVDACPSPYLTHGESPCAYCEPLAKRIREAVAAERERCYKAVTEHECTAACDLYRDGEIVGYSEYCFARIAAAIRGVEMTDPKPGATFESVGDYPDPDGSDPANDWNSYD